MRASANKVHPSVRLEYITDSIFLGGDTRSEVWLLEKFAKLGFSITAFTAPYGPTAEKVARIQGIRHVRTDFGTADGVHPELYPRSRRKGLVLFASSVGRVAWDAWQTRPHVIFAGDRTRPMLAARVAARVAGASLVFHPQFFFASGLSHAKVKRNTARAADLVIGNSRFVTGSYEKAGVQSAKLMLAYNAVDPEEFSPAASSEVRRLFRIPEDKLLIGIFGILRPFKGHDVLLRAMPEILAAVSTAHLLIVGDGPLRDALEGLATELRLHEHVTFTGFQEDPVPFYRALDLYVMASAEEPFGLVTIEAMACEKAVVGSASGGTVEIIEQNVTGLLVPPGRVETLAAACITLLRDPQQRQIMGKRGRQRVLERFTLQHRVDQIAGALTRLKRGNGAADGGGG